MRNRGASYKFSGLRAITGAISPGTTGAAPGIFMQLPSTRGAILNQDGKLNTETNPAARASIIVFYLTGAGPQTRRREVKKAA